MKRLCQEIRLLNIVIEKQKDSRKSTEASSEAKTSIEIDKKIY